ncbi:MAG TPA: TetR/AcrR family transcriptional regulator [Frankiaceae bacterium]|nr:TetR/AcrR family transcriptional regulator [Frankiaceae bacterium]
MTDPTGQSSSWLDPYFCPAGRRRRGPALEQALYSATLGQLAEHGLGAMTMEGVAAAARTGKASLYRRWSTKEDLVLDAVGCAMPAVEDYDSSTGSLREDLLHLLSQMATFVNGPNGQIVRSLLCGAEPGHPLLEMARTRLIDPRLHRLVRLIEQAVDRGEARPGSATPTLAQVGPAIAIHRFLLFGRVTEDDVAEIVDSVVLPLLQDGPRPPHAEPPAAPPPRVDRAPVAQVH